MAHRPWEGVVLGYYVLPRPCYGHTFALHMVIDLCSRAIVGFVVAERENSQLAAAMFADIFTRFPEVHTVHSDNGAAMTSKRLGKLGPKWVSSTRNGGTPTATPAEH